MKSRLRARGRIGAVAALGVALSVGIAAWIQPSGWADPVADPVRGAEESLGYPIGDKKLSQESSIGYDADGRPLVFWVTAGNDEVPAMFQVVDVIAGERIFAQRLPAGVNSWASTWSVPEQRVYFGLTSGHLYSWAPGDTEVTQHAFPLAGEQIWRLFAAPDGIIYGGTYPGGLLFQYDPASGIVTNLGQVNDGETYVRSLWANDDYLFVGSQPNAKLVRYDRATGERTAMPLPDDLIATGNLSSVYDMVGTEKLLLTRIESTGTMLVWDLETLEVVDRVQGITSRVISKPDPTGTYVLFRMNNGVDPTSIYQYVLETGEIQPTGFSPNAFPGAFEFFEHPDQTTYPGHTLIMTYYNGRIYTQNFEVMKGTYIGEGILEGTPNPIQTIGSGPDGKVYISGFLSPPGVAQFDPASSSYSLLAGAGQLEGIDTWGDNKLVMGRYPGADLLVYDTTQPWKSGENPAAPVTIDDSQDRPHKLVDIGDRVAVSTAPKSGQLGGAITLWNPLTGEMNTHRNLVENQSVVSLAFDEEAQLLYGATSINGGYGIDPVTSEAKIFRFDLASEAVTGEWVPVAGANSANALVFDDEGLLWGVADGTLFSFDTQTETVKRSEDLFGASSQMYGTGRSLVFKDDGFLYVGESSSLWRVDPETWETVRMASGGVTEMTEGPDGNLYYARGARLFRWNFGIDEQQTPNLPVTTATLSGEEGADGWWRSTVGLELAVDMPDSKTSYALNGSPWATYTEPIEMLADGQHLLSYHSRSPERHVEGARTQTISIDSTAPTVAFVQSTGKNDVTLGIVALDEVGINSLPGAVSSGVASLEVRIGDGDWMDYVDPLSLTLGSEKQLVAARATDGAGNVTIEEFELPAAQVTPDPDPDPKPDPDPNGNQENKKPETNKPSGGIADSGAKLIGVLSLVGLSVAAGGFALARISRKKNQAI